MRAIEGHLFTFAPYLRSSLLRIPLPPSRHFGTALHDAKLGEIRITGRLGPELAGDELLVVVHGLGGGTDSYYMADAARAAARAGISCLRLNMRGADRRGDDYYHAGLSEDIAAAMASPLLDRFRRVYLLGYSLGGHTSLCYASGAPDPRVRAVAAICPPMDLAGGAAEIDRPHRALYRGHLLAGLKEIYRAVAARRPVPLPVRDAMAIDSVRAWDEQVVAPRFGFAGAEDYWQRTTVVPRLRDIALPALTVSTERDPMVLDDYVRPHLEPALNIRSLFVRGGHVGFPAGTDLGLGYGGSVEDQMLGWMRARAGRAGASQRDET